MKAGKRKPASGKAKKIQQIIRLLIIFSLAGVLVSGYFITRQIREYEKGNHTYSDLRKLARPVEQTDPPPPDGTNLPSFVSPIDFKSLGAINDDTVGWLVSKGTVIDYPVVQGSDNSYYLKHLFDGAPNRLGTLFLDYRNSNRFEDRVSVIYGHNMRDQSMLTSIAGYVDQAYYDAHPAMTFFTPSATYAVRLFAGVTVSGTSGALRLSFTDDDDFLDYIEDLEERSTFTGIDTVSSSDRIVALVTCTYSFQNARYILFGKLEKIN